jgi:outer membrane protein
VRFIVKRSVIVLLAAALTGFVSLAGAAEGKIGAVNTEALMQGLPQFANAQKALAAEFEPRQTEIQALDRQLKTRQEALQKDGATMTDMQRSNSEKDLRDRARELQLKQTAFEDDYNAYREQEMQKLNRVVRDEIAAFSKANGYDLILAGGVAYASSGYDVTNLIIESIKKKSGVATTPAAPAATPAKPATTPAKPPATAPAKP